MSNNRGTSRLKTARLAQTACAARTWSATVESKPLRPEILALAAEVRAESRTGLTNQETPTVRSVQVTEVRCVICNKIHRLAIGRAVCHTAPFLTAFQAFFRNATAA